MPFPEAARGLWDWDTKHERSQEKPSATLILVHSSNLSLVLCTERAPTSQLGQGTPRGYPSVPRAETAVRHCERRGQHRQQQPRAPPPPLSDGNPESFLCQWRVTSPHPIVQVYPRLCPHKGGWFRTVSPRSAANPGKPHPAPKTSA